MRSLTRLVFQQIVRACPITLAGVSGEGETVTPAHDRANRLGHIPNANRSPARALVSEDFQLLFTTLGLSFAA